MNAKLEWFGPHGLLSLKLNMLPLYYKSLECVILTFSTSTHECNDNPNGRIWVNTVRVSPKHRGETAVPIEFHPP